ncbi:MAG: ATP-binding protein [Candidatus Omnitrophota bacterium]|nr:ATP-binding protein [Candidatus Omnitrophota bacterium]
MKKYKIFVSGVQKELREERLAVRELVESDVLLKEYFNVFLFEKAPAGSKSSKAVYLKEVQDCDVYIVIFGDEYAKAAQNRLSATEEEFREAQKRTKYVLVYIKGKTDETKDKRIKKLISEIKDDTSGYKYRRFENIPELKNAVHESLIEFLREKGIVGKSIFDEAVCEGASWKDIDNDKVKWFLRTAKGKRNFSLPENTPVKDIFIHLNLLKGNKLTNAAILLFGKNPHKFHLQAETKCLQSSGTEIEKPFPSYHIYNGNLFDQVDRSVAFVLSSIKLPVIQQIHTAQVKRPPEIPLFAVQEAIVNALAHRNYNDTSGVQVMLFIDRVEVWNSGSLPSQLTISDLKKPHRSFPGNPLLAEVFYLADYIQKVGSGTLEMIRQCKAQGLPEPEFSSTRGEFRTILGRDIFTECVLAKLGLNERQLKVVKYVKEKGQITNREYRDLTGLETDRTALRDLVVLCKKGILKKTGTTGRNTIYLLTRHKPDKPDRNPT